MGVFDLINEFKELMTDGFKEMVLKDNNNYKTSYETKNDSDTLLNAIENKYKNSLKKLESDISKIEPFVNQFSKYCEETVRSCLLIWCPIIENHNSLEIKSIVSNLKSEYSHLSFKFIEGGIVNSKIMDSFKVKTKSPFYIASSPSLNISNNNHPWIKHIIQPPISFEYKVSKRDRINASKNYENAVKDYEVMIEAEINNHKNARNRLKSVKNQLDERTKIISSFSDNLNKIITNKIRSEILLISTLLMSVIITATSVPILEENQSQPEFKGLINDINKVKNFLFENGGQ